MQRKPIQIFIAVAIIVLVLSGCARSPNARVWQTRDTVETAVVDGFVVSGNGVSKSMTLSSAAIHPTGLYLQGGKTATVSVSADAISRGLSLTVTALSTGNAQSFPLDGAVVHIAAAQDGFLDIVGSAQGAVVDIIGATAIPLYRYGTRDTLTDAGQSVVQLWMGNLYVVAPSEAVNVETLDEVCRYWRTVVELCGLSDPENPLRIMFSDGVPNDNGLRFSLSDAAVFFDPARLYAGEGERIFKAIAGQAKFGFIGKTAGVRALTYRLMTRLTLCAVRRTIPEPTLYSAYGIFRNLDVAGDTFSRLSDEVRAAFLIGLDEGLGLDVSKLVGATTVEELVLSAARAARADISAYADYFHITLSEETLRTVKGYGNPFYPLYHLFVSRVPFGVLQGMTRLDCKTYAVDPLGVYSWSKAKGKGLKKVSDGVYDFTPATDATAIALTYKNRTTGKKTTLGGTAVTLATYRFSLPQVSIPSIDREPPATVAQKTVIAPYRIPVTARSLSYSGEFEALDGAYVGGTCALGQRNASVSLPFYGETALVYTYPSDGKAVVAIDGKTAATIDLSAGGVVFTVDGLREKKHTLNVTCTDGQMRLGYFAVGFDPTASIPFPKWATVALWAGGTLLVVVGIVLLLFLFVFPLVNKLCGTSIPCRNFRSVRLARGETVKEKTRTAEKTKRAAKTKTQTGAPVLPTDSANTDDGVATFVLPDVIEEPDKLPTISFPTVTSVNKTKTVDKSARGKGGKP